MSAAVGLSTADQLSRINDRLTAIEQRQIDQLRVTSETHTWLAQLLGAIRSHPFTAKFLGS